jgi:hypothetical protein
MKHLYQRQFLQEPNSYQRRQALSKDLKVIGSDKFESIYPYLIYLEQKQKKKLRGP